MQFLPRLAKLPNSFVSDKTEISPDGRYLAVAFTNTTDHGSFPPDRIYLWDRTKAKDTGNVIYSRPGSELNSWQFSADGRRLYVKWWQPLHEQTRPEGRLGAEVVDLKDKTTHELKLPTFKNAAGGEETMHFMAASSDGRTFLVVGDGLHVADNEGRIERTPNARSGRSRSADIARRQAGSLRCRSSQGPERGAVCRAGRWWRNQIAGPGWKVHRPARPLVARWQADRVHLPLARPEESAVQLWRRRLR